MTHCSMCYPHSCPDEGERLKAEKLALLEARREAYIRRGRRALLLAMLDGDGTGTADGVRAAVELPQGIDPRCLGSVPGALAYQKIIRAAGFVRSVRAERHASWVQIWALADRAAAVQWLADHPDLEDTFEQGEVVPAFQGFLFDPQETATPTGTAAGAAL